MQQKLILNTFKWVENLYEFAEGLVKGRREKREKSRCSKQIKFISH